MPITINGTGSIEGISAGRLPDASITAAELASGAINTQALALFNASGSAPVYACRAWVNFNGTGTVAIRASGNVSSITDNGTGDYTVNFTTAMPDVNYAITNGNGDISWGAVSRFSALATNNFRLEMTGNSTTGNSDCSLVCISIFR